MSRVTRIGPKRPVDYSTLGGESGQVDGAPASPDCCEDDITEIPDRGNTENGASAFTWGAAEEIDPADDLNLEFGTVTDGGGNRTWNNPANSNDDDVSTMATANAGVRGAGTHTVIMHTDLGASRTVESMLIRFDGNPGWTLIESSPDNSAWTSRAFTESYTASPEQSLLTLDTPVAARYWRVTHAIVHTGLTFLQALGVRTWAISGSTATVGDSGWFGDGDDAIDGNDTTYIEATGEEVLLVDLGAEYRIVSSRLHIAEGSSGAKVYTVKAANEADLSDEVEITSIAFTGTGSFTAQDVESTFGNSTAYRYWILYGDAGDTRRVHSWELREGSNALGLEAHTTDADDAHDASAISYDPTASGMTATNVQDAIDELEASGGGGVTDHGALTGLGDDDHTQYVLRSILTTRGDLFRRGAADVERVALGAAGRRLGSDGTDAVWVQEFASLVITLEGGGAAIAGGQQGWIRVPFDCEIVRGSILLDTSGDIVVDVWVDTYANYPPTDADSITAAAPLTISGGVKVSDTTLTGWTKTLAEGSIVKVNVDSAATAEMAVIELRVRKTA